MTTISSVAKMLTFLAKLGQKKKKKMSKATSNKFCFSVLLGVFSAIFGTDLNAASFVSRQQVLP